MKTPEEIAADRMELQPSGMTTLFLGGKSVYNIPPQNAEWLRKAMALAVEADRQQRAVADESTGETRFANSLAAALYECLTDRETPEALRAAEWVAANENDQLWDRFVGPLMDEIEKAVA